MAAGILKRTINATRLIYFLYQVLEIAFSPALALYLLYRGMRDPGYFAHIGERFGFPPRSYEPTGPGPVWFHAVSVGEVLSAVELIRRMRADRPRSEIFVSTTTLAGRATADRALGGLADGVFYAPIDYRSVVRRVLRRLRPALVVILETEIWPNLYREAKRAGASLLVVNGRISDRALPRYRKWAWFFRHALRWPDQILAQSEQDAIRYVQAGAARERVRVAGNLKYDFEPPARLAPEIAAFFERVRPAEVWIAASTMPPAVAGDPDEDDAVVEAFQTLAKAHPGLLLILAPRRPERFEVAAGKLARAGVSFVRRSTLGAGGSDPVSPGVLLLDSIGELAAVFGRASVVFMGGTLASRGGHNILEPAYFAKPIMAGPHMENFAAIAEEFSLAGGVVRIASAAELAPAVETLLRDRSRAAEMGRRARELAMSKRGVVARIAQELMQAAARGVPSPPRTPAARLALGPLAALWEIGNRWNLARKRAAQRKLDTPVISVGSLNMGGAGKSPVVAHLARRLAEQGREPAILTRGYRRKSANGVLVVPRGQRAAVSETGDEAQMFVRSGVAHVGIGADRYQAGRAVEAHCKPGVFLLDDGFQHVQLARDHDIVLVDALDPLGGGIFPLGRRREPLGALARAAIVLVTRTEPGGSIEGIERLVRRHNATAPIFRSRVTPREWVQIGSCARLATGDPPFRRVAAFCALGSPRAFRRTLRELDLEPVVCRAFRDHHRYRPEELRRLAEEASAAGAEAIVTTQKDVMNLCEGAAELLAPHRTYWLTIEVEIENEAELLRRLS
jgi:tetraacyldisaccharide 4'-kinase